MTRTNGSATVKSKIDAKKYARLLAASLPAVIETEAENDRLVAVARELMKKGPQRTLEETRLLKLLSHLIQEFEERVYQPRTATPHEVLCELIAANGLKQSDLLPIFGSKGVTSEVVNGKRGISKTQAKALAEFFHVSVDVFL
jgi:HTH-type transcriptional regulator/antitoxin HigA